MPYKEPQKMGDLYIGITEARLNMKKYDEKVLIRVFCPNCNLEDEYHHNKCFEVENEQKPLKGTKCPKCSQPIYLEDQWLCHRRVMKDGDKILTAEGMFD